MRFLALVAGGILAAALPAALPLRAQTDATATAQTQGHAATQTQSPAGQQSEQQPLQLHVTEVRLPVTVRGPHGDLAWDLAPEDFKVYDDGVLQHIEHFNTGTLPLSVVLVVESSSRIEPLMKGIRSSGIVFTQSVMGANSRGAVISFDDAPKVLVPFTSNPELIQNAISKLKVGDSGVHLYDAVSEALQMLATQSQDRRRVIVVISESRDGGSEDKLGNVLRNAQLENVAIYTIGLSTTEAEIHNTTPTQPLQIGPPGTFSGPGIPGVPQTPSTMAETGQNGGNINLLPLVETLVKKGINLIFPQALQAASLATGGDHVATFKPASIQNAMDRIGGELHAAYTLAYSAPLNGPYGYHEISVTVSLPGYHAQTRPGYYLAPPNGSTTAGQ